MWNIKYRYYLLYRLKQKSEILQNIANQIFLTPLLNSDKVHHSNRSDATGMLYWNLSNFHENIFQCFDS